ncbi:UNVERIFIED_CONTAM: hypothetical protein NY603_38770, partial [Bacteroidetes bacterium 56_B9]
MFTISNVVFLAILMGAWALIRPDISVILFYKVQALYKQKKRRRQNASSAPKFSVVGKHRG